MSTTRIRTARVALALTLCLALLPGDVFAGAREQARRLHDRIAGVPPSQTVLAQMEAEIAGGDPLAAADIAMQNKSFWNVTLKNMATPWTNRDQTRFAPLNDYTATVIGAVRDGLDFRRILFDDILYVGVSPDATPLPAYSNDNNDHYATLENRALDLRNVLQQRSQSSLNGLPPAATAGVLTSRAAAKSFFFAGTNRAMLRFTLMNHLCRDLEQLKDNTLPPDRIRQDVSRSPGGDSRVFFGTCLACHSGMDPLAQAFAYYDFEGIEDDPAGSLSYNGSGATDPFTGIRVKKKYWINSNNFVHGFITPDDAWENRWRTGANAHLGWSGALPGNGNGAKSLGQELAYSEAFAQCQVTKVFRTVCLREPTTNADHAAVGNITAAFRDAGYNLRRAFAETGTYCMGN
ncbi:MAG: hypothetical protein ACOY33_11760 [Pseudomonadota bacterium]